MPHNSMWSQGSNNIHLSFAVLFLISPIKSPSKPSVAASLLGFVHFRFILNAFPYVLPTIFLFVLPTSMLLPSMPDTTCKGCLKYLLYFCITLPHPQTKPDSDKTAQVPRQALHTEPGIFSAPHSHLSVTAPDRQASSWGNNHLPPMAAHFLQL